MKVYIVDGHPLRSLEKAQRKSKRYGVAIEEVEASDREFAKKPSTRKRVKGMQRRGRKTPVSPQQILVVARIRERQAKEKRGSSIKFHCSKCNRETDSGHATGTVCAVCTIKTALGDDQRLYTATTLKMAKYHAQGLDTRHLFAQAMRIHERMIHRLALAGIDEKQAKAIVEETLADAEKKGGRIIIPKLGDLLRASGAKVTK